MLPASTGDRKERDITQGKQDGRGVEIQRLIGRSLRVVVDFKALGERSVYVDCDVLAGRRRHPLRGDHRRLRGAAPGARRSWSTRATIETMPLTGSVAAVSVGMVDGRALCDLDYSEDSTAEVDANVVMTGDGGLVEVQATAERTPLSRASLDELLGLAEGGIARLRRGAGAGSAAEAARCRDLSPPRNEHKLRELRETPAGRRAGAAAGGGRAAARGRRDLRRERADKARAAHAATGRGRRSPTTPGSRPTALGGRPGSTRPATPARTRPTRRTWRSCCARSRRRGRPPRRLRLRARPGRRGRRRARLRGPLRGRRWPSEPRGERRLRLRPGLRPRRHRPRRRAHDGRAQPGGEERDQPPRPRGARCSPRTSAPARRAPSGR